MNTILKRLIILILSLFFSKFAIADIASYSETHTLKIDFQHYTVIHYHDFTNRRNEQLRNVNYFGKDAIFEDSLNTYSYIIAINNQTKDTLFKRPCPAFQEIKILNKGKYIVGMSNVKLCNPYQLVVWDSKGNLLFKKDFTEEKYELSDSQLMEFIRKFPDYFLSTVGMNGIDKIEDYWAVTLLDGLYDEKNNSYRAFLKTFPHSKREVFGVSESVTNYVFWYSLNRPNVEIEEVNGKIESIVTYYDSDECEGLGKFQNRILVRDNIFNFQYFIDENYIQIKDTTAFRDLERLEGNQQKGKLHFPYLQFGELFDFYSDINTFLKNDELKFMDSRDLFDSCFVSSFKMTIFYKEGWVKFDINANKIPEYIKAIIRKLPNVGRIEFKNVEVAMIKNKKITIKNPFDISYRII